MILRIQLSAYVKDAVYAASDGIVTTFAVVAGVAGAALDPVVVLILGFANLFADSFSMAAGNFLGSRSEIRVYERERRVQEKGLEERSDQKQKDIEEILARRGYSGAAIRQMSALIMSNSQFAVDVMMDEAVKILKPEEGRPARNALVTFFSFIIAGMVPLVPYIAIASTGNPFAWAVLLTALALFFVGAIRVVFMGGSASLAGCEMLVVGGVAAAIAYLVGVFLRGLIG